MLQRIFFEATCVLFRNSTIYMPIKLNILLYLQYSYLLVYIFFCVYRQTAESVSCVDQNIINMFVSGKSNGNMPMKYFTLIATIYYHIIPQMWIQVNNFSLFDALDKNLISFYVVLKEKYDKNKAHQVLGSF